MKRILTFVLAISLPVTPFLRTGEAQEGPRQFTNLQTLPEDITTDALLKTMKRLTKALGVDCRFCHRTDIRDFATDEIEAKRVARQMMEMVDRINRELSGRPDAPEVTCLTCHRGRRKPESPG